MESIVTELDALCSYSSGARVVMACRDIVKTNKAVDDIRKETAGLEGLGEIVVVKLDLASLKSVEQCALHILRTEQFIHLLVNNAGTISQKCSYGR